MICGMGSDRPETPASMVEQHEELNWCCFGASVHGAHACTCWEPVYDIDQQEPRPGPRMARDGMCGDCAFRANSPERVGDDRYVGSDGELDYLVARGIPFHCHQGMRRVLRWEHPLGLVLECPVPDDYAPPIIDNVPYQADGSPALLCGGWAAHTLRGLEPLGSGRAATNRRASEG